MEAKTNSKFFVTKEIFEQFTSEPKIAIEGRFISIAFIKAILENEKLFEYTLNYFNGLHAEFIVTYNALRYIKYSKHIILKAIEHLFKKGILSSKIHSKKYSILKSITSEESFLAKYADKVYHVSIDNIEYDIPIKCFIAFLNSKKDDYNKGIKSKMPEIFGIPIEHFIYALVSFIKTNDIMANYELNDQYNYRITSLSHSNDIDIQAINRFLQTEDATYEKVQIATELRLAILGNMPRDFSLLEKAIYIYIKMCEILTYDDEYYVEKKANLTRNHSDISYVKQITPQNNKVVCFEFNAIYTRLLSELGINFKSHYYSGNNDDYGKSHVYADFRVDKYLVSADSTKTILQSDITRAKVGLSLRRIECLNNNPQTKKEFEEALSKVYAVVLKEHGRNTHGTFDELLSQYRNIHNSVAIPLEEKLDILLSKVNDASLLGVDALSYILTLRDVIFNGYETNNNIFYVIIRNKLNPVDNQNAMASAIFTINTLGLGEDRNANRYFFYNPGEPLKELSKEDLEYCFNEGIFAYIETGSPAIPGLAIGDKR